MSNNGKGVRIMAEDKNLEEPDHDCPVCGGYILWKHQKDNTWAGSCGTCRRAFSRDDDDKED